VLRKKLEPGVHLILTQKRINGFLSYIGIAFKGRFKNIGVKRDPPASCIINVGGNGLKNKETIILESFCVVRYKIKEVAKDEDAYDSKNDDGICKASLAP